MNITVYCGARLRQRSRIRRSSSAELGKWMGKNGHRLVYGAGDCGMMGTLSNAVLEAAERFLEFLPDFSYSQKRYLTV